MDGVDNAHDEFDNDIDVDGDFDVDVSFDGNVNSGIT